MDNALIDDRRIHVDFSQSVSKLWSQYRRKGSQSSKGKVGCVCICLCNKQLMLRKILVASVLTLGNSQATWFDFPYRLHQFIWNQPLSKARKTQCISLSLCLPLSHTQEPVLIHVRKKSEEKEKYSHQMMSLVVLVWSAETRLLRSWTWMYRN